MVVSYDTIRDSIKTGDVVLFSGKGHVSEVIKLVSGGPWSHVGLAMRLEEYDMVLLLESTTLGTAADVETGRVRRGVQLVPLSERVSSYDGRLAIRQLSKPLESGMLSKLHKFRKRVSRRPYERDLSELFRAAYDGPFGGQGEDLSSLFCSELVAESFQRVGLLPEPPNGLPSNEYTPRDFSSAARTLLNLNKGYALQHEIELRP